MKTAEQLLKEGIDRANYRREARAGSEIDRLISEIAKQQTIIEDANEEMARLKKELHNFSYSEIDPNTLT